MDISIAPVRQFSLSVRLSSSFATSRVRTTPRMHRSPHQSRANAATSSRARLAQLPHSFVGTESRAKAADQIRTLLSVRTRSGDRPPHDARLVFGANTISRCFASRPLPPRCYSIAFASRCLGSAPVRAPLSLPPTSHYFKQTRAPPPSPGEYTNSNTPSSLDSQAWRAAGPSLCPRTDTTTSPTTLTARSNSNSNICCLIVRTTE